MDRLEQKICDIIDSKKDEIIAFGRDIWTHAELGSVSYTHLTCPRKKGAGPLPNTA